MEYSLTFLTLWLYIKEMVNTDIPKLYYGVVSVSYMVASSVLTPFIGRVVDKRRNIKACFLLCNMLMFTGNVVYSCPFSPFLLIVGRIIAGFGGALKSVTCSETIRSYPVSETSSKLSILSVMHNFGLMLGPGINFFFKDMSFYIGRWHLRDVNFPGLFMGFLCLMMEILTLTMVYDVSKEFDYKASVEKNAINNKVDEVINNSEFEDNEKIPIVQYNSGNENKILLSYSHKHTVIEILKVLFFHFDSALVLFSTFFLAFFLINADMWLPLLVIEKMHLSILEMNISFFGASGFCALMLVLFMWKPLSDYKMLVLLIIGLCGFSAVSASFIILSKFPYNKALNVTLCIVYMFSFGGAPILVDVFFVNILAKMVNSNVQTFVDSIRSSMFSAGAFIALSCSAFLFDYVEIFGSLYIAIMMIIGFLFIYRKKHLAHPKLLL